MNNRLCKYPYKQLHITQNFYDEKFIKNSLKTLLFYSNCKMKKPKFLKIFVLKEIHKKYSENLNYLFKMNYSFMRINL